MSMTYISKKHDYAATLDEKEQPKDQKSASVESLLVRTTKLTTVTIKLYRIMVFVRMAIFVLFFKWRISTALAMISDGATTVRAMWTMPIAGELWFALMWVLDQLPKMQPVRRTVFATALEEPLLPTMDVFVTTADPEKEPPLVTVNTILSILAADYPPDKLTCYVSDDGGALLTREAVAHAARFARLWVPFCRKHGVEPRNPEAYFCPGVKARVVSRAAYMGRSWPELARDRRRVRREYEELRLRIDALHAGDVRRQPWSRGTPEYHAGVVEVLVGPPGSTPELGVSDLLDLTSVDVRVPAVVYMCREKRHGRVHHRKAGAMNALLRTSAVLSNAPFILNLDCDDYVNNSQALRAGVCLMLDRGGSNVAFVQFPQRFDGVDPADRYANHNRVFFDCTELGLDGLQGPIYVGTGCMFRRAALYNADPPLWRPHGGDRDAGKDVATEADKFGISTPFLVSVRAALNLNRSEQWNTTSPPRSFDGAAVGEATALVSCGYEDRTAWGRDIGWIYGTVTEDVATGFCMHRRGWRSAYCATAPDAFRGTAPINLTDRLHQVLRWAAGSLEIFFSRNNALLAGARLHPLQRLAYLNTTVYPFTSIFLLLYCLLPAIPLVTRSASTSAFSVNTPPSATYIGFVAALMLTLAMVAALEVRWSGITLGEWWRNEQFWMVSATSAYAAAVVQVALKVAAGKEIAFKLTSKQRAPSAGGGVVKDRFAELYAVRWTVLMVPTAVVLTVNVASMAAAVQEGRWRKGPAAVLAMAFNAWVVVHLHPFALGLMGRWSKTLSPLLLLVVVFTVLSLCFVLHLHML
ncbi:probable mixed-linked glucan synthase 7 [Triticum dicoccoides]|uniref:probable mixed-linked glucan synthase 7 n=1 Tax=Triticum dicoccoides TaxID=85692 RepID=UPI0018908FC9|nr:probable mixed-linked glucan synthase 7 [Triticum dicoccoides]